MFTCIFSIVKKNYRQWGPLFLRIAIGCGFIVHGWAKLDRGPAGFAKLLAQAGVPFSEMAAWVGTLVELLGGMAILLGVLVSIAAIPLIFTMLVAMFTVQVNYGFSSVKTIGLTPQGPVFGPPGYEINLLYIAGLLSLMLTGAGIFSVDAWIAGRRTRTS